MAAAPSLIDAIVLAGGLGTRLRPVLPDRQKVTAPIGGQPFLARLIDWLAKAGVARVVLAAGHLATDVQAVAAAYAGSSPEVLVSVEPAPLGTAGAVRLASDLTRSDPVLVLNGDSFADIDLAALRRLHAARKAQVSLALVPVPEPGRYGLVDIDDNGAVTSFREKPPVDSPAGAINAGIYLFQRAALAAIPENYPMSLERDIFPNLIGKGLHAMVFNAGFIDIGTPDSLRGAADFFGVKGAAS